MTRVLRALAAATLTVYATLAAIIPAPPLTTSAAQPVAAASATPVALGAELDHLTVAAMVQQWVGETPVVWADDPDPARRGVWDGTDLTLWGRVTDGSPDVYISPASLAGARWGDLTPGQQTAVYAVVQHELSHLDIITRCGTAAPPIAGDRYEHVADAWAVTYRPTRSLSAGGYGYTSTDAAIAAAIHAGHCA